MKIYHISQNEYRGAHTAPGPGSGAPMHDLSSIYPGDLYSSLGPRYYGTREPWDNFSFRIVQEARNRPNYRVKIYRAVPKVNPETDNQIKRLQFLLSYYNKFGFFPVDHFVVHEIQKDLGEQDYDSMIANTLAEIPRRIEKLRQSKDSEITSINEGDWVTINPAYAKFHGKSWLDNQYKVLSKTVMAKELYTNGDSIHEWGYWPS